MGARLHLSLDTIECSTSHYALSAGDQQPHRWARPPARSRFGLYRNVVLKYELETGINAKVNGLCVHSLRATARPSMRWRMRPISPRSRSGSAKPTSPPRGSTTAARCARKTAQRSESGTDLLYPEVFDVEHLPSFYRRFRISLTQFASRLISPWMIGGSGMPVFTIPDSSWTKLEQ